MSSDAPLTLEEALSSGNVIIRCSDGKSITVHRVQLALASVVLRSLFESFDERKRPRDEEVLPSLQVSMQTMTMGGSTVPLIVMARAMALDIVSWSWWQKTHGWHRE